MASLKFEDWDLAHHEKFSRLEIKNLMKPNQNTVTRVTELKPPKWLCRVEKTRLLNLLWMSHFHHAPITIFIIRQLLSLVHDGCLWLVEPIPITANLIHCISRLPCKEEDPTDISEGKGSDLVVAKAMKKKYKLEKKKRGYAISNIKEKLVHVVTQILVGRVMRKCRANEVSTSVVALAE